MTSENPDGASNNRATENIVRPKETPTRGFGSADYVRALAEFGAPTHLPRSDAWCLKRPIPGSNDFDAMGGYPFFVCQNWAGLADDLAEAGRNLVSFSATPDPFGEYDLTTLQNCFPDVCIHFKDHHVADLTVPTDKFVSDHHRRTAEKALKQVEVEFCTEPLRYLDQWVALFDLAVQKFKITGIRAYSRASFARQLTTPGAVMSLARFRGEVVAIHLQFVEREVCYAHMAASNQTGYKVGAAYALYLAELNYYTGKARWLDWGGEPGVAPGSGGLTSFKQGWSTGIRPAYFCGRIFQPSRYAEIAQAKGLAATKYFPAYRQGEFG